jgi:hypothetical protein
MGHHLDVHEIAGHLGKAHVLGVLVADAREHQLLVGVLVIHHEEAVLARPVDRDEGQEVAVVAELAPLGLGRLRLRVEGGRARQHRIAPPQQDLRIVTLGDVVGLIHPRLDLLEVERGGLGLLGRLLVRRERAVADRGGDRRDRKGPAQEVAAVESGGDDLAHGEVLGRVVSDVPRILEFARPQAHRRLVHHLVPLLQDRAGLETFHVRSVTRA